MQEHRTRGIIPSYRISRASVSLALVALMTLAGSHTLRAQTAGSSPAPAVASQEPSTFWRIVKDVEDYVKGLVDLFLERDTDRSPGACSWMYLGGMRDAVKLRPPSAGEQYQVYNHGSPITVDEWFNFTCTLDPKVPEKITDAPLPGLETIKVTLRGYLLGAGLAFDHDLHAELSASRDWTSDHVIVEVPPGPEFCEARSALWELVSRDIKQSKGDRHARRWLMHTPVEVEVVGFVFLDAVHAKGSRDFCHEGGGRGFRRPLPNATLPGEASHEQPAAGSNEPWSDLEKAEQDLSTNVEAQAATASEESREKSMVRGVWELHPVIEVKNPSKRSIWRRLLGPFAPSEH